MRSSDSPNSNGGCISTLSSQSARDQHACDHLTVQMECWLNTPSVFAISSWSTFGDRWWSKFGDCFHEEENATACGTTWEKSAKTLARLCLSRENYAVLTASAEERAESDVLHQAGIVSLPTQAQEHQHRGSVFRRQKTEKDTHCRNGRGQMEIRAQKHAHAAVWQVWGRKQL